MHSPPRRTQKVDAAASRNHQREARVAPPVPGALQLAQPDDFESTGGWPAVTASAALPAPVGYTSSKLEPFVAERRLVGVAKRTLAVLLLRGVVEETGSAAHGTRLGGCWCSASNLPHLTHVLVTHLVHTHTHTHTHRPVSTG